MDGAYEALRQWMPAIRALNANRRPGTLGVIIPETSLMEQAEAIADRIQQYIDEAKARDDEPDDRDYYW
jgi:hypothetical protein